MSDRRTHRAIGTLAGGGFALAKAQQRRPEHLLLEVLGGLVAGPLAGLLGGYSSHVALDGLTPAGQPPLP